MKRSSRLRREFLKFHRDNPWVYEYVEDYCDRLWRANWRFYSIRTIISVIRFNRDLETSGEDVVVDGGETLTVKLNNNHSPYYARLLAYRRPKFRKFFNFRTVAGEIPGHPILFSDVPGEPDIHLDGSVVERARRIRRVA